MVNNHKSFADSDQEMASEDDHNDGVESVLEVSAHHSVFRPIHHKEKNGFTISPTYR